MIMGNLSFKSDTDQLKAGTLLIQTPTRCPKCDKLFYLQTTYDTLNAHLNSCKGTQGEPTIKISKTSAPENSTPVSKKKIVKQSFVENYEPFIWVKTQNNAQEDVWQKQKKATEDTDFSGLSYTDLAKLDFESKRKWFRNKSEAKRIGWMKGADYLKVDRSKLLESSLSGIKSCNLHKEVKIVFLGDEKVNDAGGLMREWMSLIIKELASPDLGVFVTTDSDEVSYTINPKAPSDSQTLSLYEFAGKVIGKTIFERMTLDIHFDYCLLGAIAGRELTLEDLRTLDTPLYNSLLYLKKNTLAGSDLFEEYFVVPERGGQVIELCTLGAKTLVTDKNKDKYIQLMVDWYGRKRNDKKINAMIKGMASCIQNQNLSIFKPQELEMIINGIPFIDVNDWESNTYYRNTYSKESMIISWFWKILREMSQEDLSRLLKYCTGSSRTPVDGFRALEGNRGSFAMFCIQSTSLEKKGRTLITADTCFNRLIIPQYKDEETLKFELYTVIQSDFDGVLGLD